MSCQSHSGCNSWAVFIFPGTGSCEKIMGVGLCTYASAAAERLQLLPAEALVLFSFWKLGGVSPGK